MQWIPSWIKFYPYYFTGPGHDAKKGEKKSNPDDPDEDTDDVPESSRGHREKETRTATTDAAKTLPEQSTHVAGTSQVNSCCWNFTSNSC